MAFAVKKCSTVVMRNLRSINLNLLPVLRVLLRHRHVTDAARALNMSQSSISETLGNLRNMFNDELLVSDGGRMTPTALARRLEPMVELALDSVETLAGRHAPVKAGARSAIDIAVNDYMILMLGVDLISEVRRVAPELAIRFHELDGHSAARLRSGDLDFMITPEVMLTSVEAEFNRKLVFQDRIVCLVDADSAIEKRVTAEQYWAAPHVFFSPKSEHYGASRTTILQQVGERKSDSTLVQSYLLLPFFVEGTEAIALAQECLARALLPVSSVKIVEAPFDIDVRIQVVWDGARMQDEQKRWFLDLLIDVAAKAQSRARSGGAM
jgi:LysR family transcriptional regulator, nod-box dependent transcriptional activator